MSEGGRRVVKREKSTRWSHVEVRQVTVLVCYQECVFLRHNSLRAFPLPPPSQYQSRSSHNIMLKGSSRYHHPEVGVAAPRGGCGSVVSPKCGYACVVLAKKGFTSFALSPTVCVCVCRSSHGCLMQASCCCVGRICWVHAVLVSESAGYITEGLISCSKRIGGLSTSCPG